MNHMKRQNDRILKEELPWSVGAQYVTGDKRRNNSRKNEGMEPKQERYTVVDVTGDRSKVFSNTTVQKHQSLALSLLYGPTLTSIRDCWKCYS